MSAPAHGLLHRHVGLHRLQGVRGRVQGVERRPRRRARASPASRTTTRGELGAEHAGATWPSSSSAAGRRRGRRATRGGSRRSRSPRTRLATARRRLRWLMASDVCKHCTHAACLEVCPTGALFRTEFGTVVVQEDICNGCGYCVPACPFGVLDRREGDGRVWKCTLCYDRLKDDPSPRARRPARPSRSSSASSTSCASAPRERVEALRGGGRDGRAAVRRRPRRRRRRLRRVLPAARRARGLRAAARPGRPPRATSATIWRRRPRRPRRAGAPGWRRRARQRRVGERERRATRRVEPRSYYGQPGDQGAACGRREVAVLPLRRRPGRGLGARSALAAPSWPGNDELARRAWLVRAGRRRRVSPPLLIADLGAPRALPEHAARRSSRPRR